MICVKCGENKAHKSHRSGWKDHVLKFLQYSPYRCRNCGDRFYAWRDGEASERLRTREEQKIMQLRRRLKWRRSKRELIAYGAGAVVLVFILYQVLEQRIPSSSP